MTYIEDWKASIHSFLMELANDYKTANVGGLHYIENEKKVPVYPYTTYQFIGGTSDRDTGARYENPIVQFTIWDNASGSSRISRLGGLLDARFDEAEKSGFVMDSYIVIGVDRISPYRENKPFEDWEFSADYQLQLQKK